MTDRGSRPSAIVIVPMAALLAIGLGWTMWRAAIDVGGEVPGPDITWRVDLNTASAEELELLSGIGGRLAQRIVADRVSNGPFASLDALTRVPGIGERTVAAIRPRAAVFEPGSNPTGPNAE